MNKKNKNKNHQVSQLSGSPKDQARQLLEILKGRSLDIESLNVLLPANVEVIKEFIVCLQSDIAANQAAYGRVIGVFEASIQTLNDIIKDGKIDEEERAKCREEILRLSQLLSDLHKEHERNVYAFWKDIGKYLLTLLGLIVVLTSRFMSNNNNKA